MKSTEFIIEAVNKRSYNKSIIDILVAHGFKVDSRETSAGALKTWLDAPNPISLREIVAALAPKFPGTKLEDWDGDMDEEIRGNSFQIEKQGARSIFLAVYAGPKAEEYAMGLDEDDEDPRQAAARRHGEVAKGADNDFGLDSIASSMKDEKTRQARLKAEVESGSMPVVHNVSYTTEPVYTCGDLEDLGWMDKEYTHDHMGEVDGWTRAYFGPAPVKIHTTGAPEPRILKPGDILE